MNARELCFAVIGFGIGTVTTAVLVATWCFVAAAIVSEKRLGDDGRG